MPKVLCLDRAFTDLSAAFKILGPFPQSTEVLDSALHTYIPKNELIFQNYQGFSRITNYQDSKNYFFKLGNITYMILGWNSLVRLRKVGNESIGFSYQPDLVYIIDKNREITYKEIENSRDYIEPRRGYIFTNQSKDKVEEVSCKVFNIKNYNTDIIYTKCVQSCMTGFIFSNSLGEADKYPDVIFFSHFDNGAYSFGDQFHVQAILDYKEEIPINNRERVNFRFLASLWPKDDELEIPFCGIGNAGSLAMIRGKRVYQNFYVFDWMKIPGADNNMLIENLSRIHKIDWIKNANISKSIDGKTINISKDGNELSLKLINNDSAVTLKFQGLYDSFIAKKRNNNLNIYKEPDIDEKSGAFCHPYVGLDLGKRKYFGTNGILGKFQYINYNFESEELTNTFLEVLFRLGIEYPSAGVIDDIADMASGSQ